VSTRTERVIAALALVLILCSCTTTTPISSADQSRGLAAVHRYVAANKHWRQRDYRVAAPERDRGLLVYAVTYLPDLKPPVAPGGGESFWAHYNVKHDVIVRVLYGQ
jgi:hypothetical protein